MRAVVFDGGRVTVGIADRPRAGRGEALVRVRAAALNGADLVQLSGRYDLPPGVAGRIPGIECAGEVVEVGDDVSNLAVGDRVMALVDSGGQAEFAVVCADRAMPVCETLDWPMAGGFAEAFTTAYDALFGQLEISLGDRVCITGAAGGVGTAATQLAVAAGCVVVATSRHAWAHEHLRAMGAVAVSPQDVREHGPFDAVLELVGASGLPQALEHVAHHGRICVIGAYGDDTCDLDVRIVKTKMVTITGSTLRPRRREEKASLAREIEARVLPLLRDGSLRVLVDRTLGLAEAEAAYSLFAAGGKLGKIVLTMA